MCNDILVDKYVNENLLKDVLGVFRAKEGGLPEAILTVLNTLSEDEFTTPRWINFVLSKSGIEREDRLIRYEIARMKRKEPIIRKTRTGKIITVNVKPTIESFDLIDGDNNFVDITGRLRGKILYKLRINDYGRGKIKKLLNSL